MWHATHDAPAPAGSWCACARSGFRRRVLGVAGRAHVVAGRRRQARQRGAVVLAVRIVAGRTRHLAPALAEQEIARLARGDAAAAGARQVTTLAALPRPRVAREQHLVTARARAVLPLGGRQRRVRRRRRLQPQQRAARLERRQAVRIVGVLARATMAGLAADADLDEVRGHEAVARFQDGPPQRRARPVAVAAARRPRRARGGARPRPQHRQLVIERAQQRVLVGDAIAEPPAGGQRAIDDLALIGRVVPVGQRPPQVIEVRESCCGRRCRSDSTRRPRAARDARRPSRSIPSTETSRSRTRTTPAAAARPSDRR